MQFSTCSFPFISCGPVVVLNKL